MVTEVRTSAFPAKKLFEWDAETHLLAIVERNMVYVYRLTATGTFEYISGRPKPKPPPPKRRYKN